MRRKTLLRLILLGVLLAAVPWFWWFENDSIQTQTYIASDSALPAAFDGLRVVEIADLHGRQFGEDNCGLLASVRTLEPDLIAIDGDLIDCEDELDMVPSLARGLAEIAPTFYVTGNHEWAAGVTDELFPMLEENGVTALRNDYRLLTKDGASIVLAGVDDPNGPYDQKTPAQLVAQIRSEQGSGAYILMLAHRNDQLDEWAALDVQTVLTGHAHGGVIRLPFIGGLIGTDRSLFPKQTAGLLEQNGTQMLASRGLGNSVVNFRLFNRPELPLLVLRRNP